MKDLLFVFLLVVSFITAGSVGYAGSIQGTTPHRTEEQVLTEMVNNLRTRITLERQLQIIGARYDALQKELGQIQADKKSDTCEGECEDTPAKDNAPVMKLK